MRALDASSPVIDISPPPSPTPLLPADFLQSSEYGERLEIGSELAQGMKSAYAQLLDRAGEGTFIVDPDGLILSLSPGFLGLTGWSQFDLVGRSHHALFQPLPHEECLLCRMLMGSTVHPSGEAVLRCKNGDDLPFSYTTASLNLAGALAGAVIAVRDLTETKRKELWEQKRNSILGAITSHQPMEKALQLIADIFRFFYPTLAIALLPGFDSHLQLVAQAGLPAECRPAFSRVSIDDPASLCALSAAGKQEITQTSIPACRDLTETGFAFCTAKPLLSVAGDLLGVLAVFDNEGVILESLEHPSIETISRVASVAIEQHYMQSTLVERSRCDHLTGLPNRLLLEDRLEQALRQSRRNGNQVAVCYIDLDRFKQINDCHGHSAGDSFLLHIAALLSSQVREVDTVARQGGDEFILVLPELTDALEAEDICARVLDAIRTPVQVGAQIMTPSASIGISMYPGDGDDASVLLQHADSALYAAKRAGRDRAEIFNHKIGMKVQREAEIQTSLHYALAKREFHLLYQPLYDTFRQLIGFEALLRWVHPDLGPIGPDQFIPVAEESGLIVPIGEWVLREACSQALAWDRELGLQVKMFVNISGVQLNRPDFTSTVSRILAETGLNPRFLELEITESWIINDPSAASAQLQDLRSLGICVSIDDFGTGHSSLSALHELAVDTIKIDRSFIARLDGSPRKSATVRTIVELARQLGLNTVAEGVETDLQCQELQGMQCGMLQGFFLARPLTSTAAHALLLGQPNSPRSSAS